MNTRITAAVHRVSRRHLEWIFRITTTRPGLVISIFLLALALAVTSITTIRFDTDIFRLFPTNQPALRLMLDSMEWSGSAGQAYFLLEGDKRTLPGEAARFAERLRMTAVDGQPAFRRITWKVFDEEQAESFSALIEYAVIHPQVFVAPKDIPLFLKRFSPAAMNETLQRLQSELAGQFGGAITALATSDPLFIRDLILPRIKSGSQALSLDPSSPYLLSRDGRVLIMIAEPARPVQDMEFARKLVIAINEARRGSSVAISCAGAHISAVLDEHAMKSNVLISIVSSLLVVLGIFYTAYRRILPTMLIPIILVCGVVLALGSAGLFIRSIHIISFAFTALITGIGTDYSIHLYDRFHSERAVGASTQEALRLALLDTGYGVFTAAITTAVPFLALCISDVRALSELGLLVGLGVIFSLYASLFFLPPLLIFMEQRYPVVYRPIPGIGLGRVWRLSGSRPGLITALTVLMSAGLCLAAFQIGFDGELKNLQPKHSEAFLTQERIEQHLSLSPKQFLVAVEGRSLAYVLSRAAQVEALAGSMLSRGEITAWSSLCRIVNCQSDQEEALRLLRIGLSGTAPADALLSKLDLHGFRIEPFRPFLNTLEYMAEAVPVAMEDVMARLAESPMRSIVEHHLVKDANGYHAMIYLHYRGPEFNQQAFLSQLARIDQSIRTTSVDMVSGQLKDTVKNCFVQSFIAGGLIVIFLLLVHFIETPTGVFYSMFPVVAGSVCMLGVMALIGMKLNFMNAMVLVTILGMGSDFGLYVRFRVRDIDPVVREAQFIQIGRSVLLSAMTTIVGFGSLAFTDYGAMSSIGWATNLGVGFTTLFSLVTLPALMALYSYLKKV